MSSPSGPLAVSSFEDLPNDSGSGVEPLFGPELSLPSFPIGYSLSSFGDGSFQVAALIAIPSVHIAPTRRAGTVKWSVAVVSVAGEREGRWAKSDLPRIQESEQGEALTLKQLVQLAEECSPYSEVILLLGLGGLRFGEVAGLRVSSVDFTTNRIHVRESLLEVSGELYTETPTNHQKRTFVAPQLVTDALKPWCEDKAGDDYVFLTSQGTPLRNSNFAKRVYKPALKRLGLPDIRIHDLRHTAVSVAKSVGGDIFDAKNQVGHSDIRTTINIYGHIFEEDSLDLAQKLDIALKNVH